MKNLKHYVVCLVALLAGAGWLSNLVDLARGLPVNDLSVAFALVMAVLASIGIFFNHIDKVINSHTDSLKEDYND